MLFKKAYENQIYENKSRHVRSWIESSQINWSKQESTWRLSKISITVQKNSIKMVREINKFLRNSLLKVKFWTEKKVKSLKKIQFLKFKPKEIIKIEIPFSWKLSKIRKFWKSCALFVQKFGIWKFTRLKFWDHWWKNNKNKSL